MTARKAEWLVRVRELLAGTYCRVAARGGPRRSAGGLDAARKAFYRHKVAQAQAQMEAEGLDGLLLLAPSNVIYLSGFWHIESERPLGLFVPAHGDPALFVPLLEQENAADSWVTDIRPISSTPAKNTRRQDAPRLVVRAGWALTVSIVRVCAAG
ncbi:MAG: aminopeptidase P family N-terminal domain-containing protein [Anaerolineae bacterium]